MVLMTDTIVPIATTPNWMQILSGVLTVAVPLTVGLIQKSRRAAKTRRTSRGLSNGNIGRQKDTRRDVSSRGAIR